jgi:hypothetical protein
MEADIDNKQHRIRRGAEAPLVSNRLTPTYGLGETCVEWRSAIWRVYFLRAEGGDCPGWWKWGGSSLLPVQRRHE